MFANYCLDQNSIKWSATNKSKITIKNHSGAIKCTYLNHKCQTSCTGSAWAIWCNCARSKISICLNATWSTCIFSNCWSSWLTDCLEQFISCASCSCEICMVCCSISLCTRQKKITHWNNGIILVFWRRIWWHISMSYISS